MTFLSLGTGDHINVNHIVSVRNYLGAPGTAVIHLVNGQLINVPNMTAEQIMEKVRESL